MPPPPPPLATSTPSSLYLPPGEEPLEWHTGPGLVGERQARPDKMRDTESFPRQKNKWWGVSLSDEVRRVILVWAIMGAPVCSCLLGRRGVEVGALLLRWDLVWALSYCSWFLVIWFFSNIFFVLKLRILKTNRKCFVMTLKSLLFVWGDSKIS